MNRWTKTAMLVLTAFLIGTSMAVIVPAFMNPPLRVTR